MNTKSKLTIAFVVLFLTGVLAGVMGTRIVYRNMLDNALERPSILSKRVEASLGSRAGAP